MGNLAQYRQGDGPLIGFAECEDSEQKTKARCVEIHCCCCCDSSSRRMAACLCERICVSGMCSGGSLSRQEREGSFSSSRVSTRTEIDFSPVPVWMPRLGGTSVKSLPTATFTKRSLTRQSLV